MIKKLLAIILCSSILLGFCGCTPSVVPEESTVNVTEEEQPETAQITTAEETEEIIPEQTAEETTVPEEKKTEACLLSVQAQRLRHSQTVIQK